MRKKVIIPCIKYNNQVENVFLTSKKIFYFILFSMFQAKSYKYICPNLRGSIKGLLVQFYLARVALVFYGILKTMLLMNQTKKGKNLFSLYLLLKLFELFFFLYFVFLGS